MACELRRDRWGIPFLRADSELELAEAQGRVTAEDRGWQIEVDRWRAEGRLAAHLGAAELEWDRLAHRSRLADTARRAYARLSRADRAWVDAYVRGINAGLPTGRRTPDFDALDALPGRAPASEPWPNWMPLGVFLVNHLLFSTFPHLLWRRHLADTMGEEALDVFDGESGPGAGSNAWALHGSRTVSGRPVLAGDPHRLLEIPGVYQQIGLACPEYDVIGLAFPGVPGVPHFGHTGFAAWGVTNALAHAAELFQETLRPGGALGPDGWEHTAEHTVTIAVRGGADESIDCIETARGPVIVTGDRSFSLRLTSRATGELGFAALRPLLRARSAGDVSRALMHWVEPVNRVLIADRSGTVLRMTAGRVPLRDPSQRRLPHDAATERTAPWREPPSARIVDTVAVDANERPERAEEDLGAAYAPSHRARRIRALLETGGNVHGDTLIDAAPLLSFLEPEHGSAPLSPPAESLRRQMLAWDRRMDAESRTAAVFAAWRGALVRRITAHPALAAVHRPHGFGALFDPWLSVGGRVADALPRLLHGAFGIDGRAEALAAMEELGAAPPSVTERTWGDRHRLHPLHALGTASIPPTRLGGDTEAVRSTSSAPGVTDVAVRGSVARWVWDLDDRDASRWGVPFGASGDPRSPHYADQLAAWARAETIPARPPERTIPEKEPVR